MFKSVFSKCAVVVYLLILAMLIAIGLSYSSRARKQFKPLTRMHSLLLSRDERIQLSTERATLSFQLAALRLHFPDLTNHTLQDHWASAAAAAMLDPQLCRKWRAYQQRASMLVEQQDPQLEFFNTLQEAYGNDVEKLALDWTATNKQKSLFVLRTDKFAVLFTNAVYLEDQRQWEKIAQGLQDTDTAALRSEYLEGLVHSLTNTAPQLAGYGAQLLQMNQKSAGLAKSIAELDDKLGNSAGLAQTSDAWSPANALRRLIASVNFSNLESSAKDLAIFEAATALVLILLTWPIELRENRWRKILASLLLVYFGFLALRIQIHLKLAEKGDDVFAFLGFLIPVAIFAAVWTPTLAGLLANVFTGLIDSAGPRATDSNNLGDAYRLARKENPVQALVVARACLSDDPRSFESRVLVARLHRKLNHRWRAWLMLKRIQRDRHLNDSQRTYVEELSREFKNPDAACWNTGAAKASRFKSGVTVREL